MVSLSKDQLKKFSNELLIKLALSEKVDLESRIMCYEELTRRRELDKKDPKKHFLTHSSNSHLIEIAKRNALKNPNVARLCYEELNFRNKIDEIKDMLNIEIALDKLDKILGDEI